MIWYLNILWDYHYGKPGNHLSPIQSIIVLLIIFLMLYIKSLWHIYFITRSLLLNPLHKFDATPISLLSGNQQFVLCIWESCSVMSDYLWPHGLYSPWNSPGQNTGVGSLSLLPGDLPNPGIKPRSPTLQVDSLPAEPPGKPKNTGVGSLSLLQRIFPT